MGDFAQGIDAAIAGRGAFFGVCWFFKGNRYLRILLEAGTEEENVPNPIIGSWGAWPTEFAEGVDFAFYGTGANAEKIYFFRGDKYILYNLKTDRVEEGPKPILKNWRNLSQFMLPPQLFIVEQYALRTFHGEMGRGPIVQGQQIQVAPRAKTEFFILTKKSETITESSSSNIFESQSQQTADIFSKAVRRDQSESGSEDKFDYQVETSFKGKADITLIPLGVEADADLKVKGAAQDVRKAFANAESNQTIEQETQTHELHKQQVSTAEASHVVNQEIETGFKQTIDNRDNPNPLNCLIFQLTQEYIIVLSLVDVKLVFHNSNPRESKIVPIRDRDIAELLDECIVEPLARARITATVIDVLQNVVDHTGQTRSMIVPNPNDPTRFQVDRALSSKFEVKDSTGRPLREIVVPGVILNVDSPVVLTPNTAMALLE